MTNVNKSGRRPSIQLRRCRRSNVFLDDIWVLYGNKKTTRLNIRSKKTGVISGCNVRISDVKETLRYRKRNVGVPVGHCKLLENIVVKRKLRKTHAHPGASLKVVEVEKQTTNTSNTSLVMEDGKCGESSLITNNCGKFLADASEMKPNIIQTSIPMINCGEGSKKRLPRRPRKECAAILRARAPDETRIDTRRKSVGKRVSLKMTQNEIIDNKKELRRQKCSLLSNVSKPKQIVKRETELSYRMIRTIEVGANAIGIKCRARGRPRIQRLQINDTQTQEQNKGFSKPSVAEEKSMTRNVSNNLFRKKCSISNDFHVLGNTAEVVKRNLFLNTTKKNSSKEKSEQVIQKSIKNSLRGYHSEELSSDNANGNMDKKEMNLRSMDSKVLKLDKNEAVRKPIRRRCCRERRTVSSESNALEHVNTEMNQVNLKSIEVKDDSEKSEKVNIKKRRGRPRKSCALLSSDGREKNEVMESRRQLREHRKSYIPTSELLRFERNERATVKAGAYYKSYNLADKIRNAKFTGHGFLIHLGGNILTKDYLNVNGFNCPILIEKGDSVDGLLVPSRKFSVADVCKYVGSDRTVDVIDVHTQKDVQMSMREYQAYVESEHRGKLYNIISLEISHTELGNRVSQPSVVRQIDWVDLYWPDSLKQQQIDCTNTLINMMYPKVQKYCLMSVKGCYTDFHIDFGGTSVWYHVVRGAKIFWLAPPTEHNLSLYRQWLLTDKMLVGLTSVFLGDWLEACERVELKPGLTFFLPSGWLHAVYTPKDTIVFGGNFLHSYSVDMQIKICHFEDELRVSGKCRYPFFNELHWFALNGFVTLLDPDGHSQYGKSVGKSAVKCRLQEQKKSLLENTRSILDYLSKCISDHTNREPQQLPFSSKLLKHALSLINKLEYDTMSTKDVTCLNEEKVVEMNAVELCNKMKEVSHHLKNITSILNCVGDTEISLAEQFTDPYSLLKKAVALFDEHNAASCTCSYLKTVNRFKTVEKIVGENKKQLSVGSNIRRRRCGKCLECFKPKCGSCMYCLNKRKCSDNNNRTHSCLHRICKQPKLPVSIKCTLCNHVGELKYVDYLSRVTVNDNVNMSADNKHKFINQLMECQSCFSVVHPRCLFKAIPTFNDYDVEAHTITHLANSWMCPKCFQSQRNIDENNSGPSQKKMNK